MSNKIIIKVYVPALNDCYDVFIPINITIKNLTKLIIDSIVEISNSEFRPNDKIRLYFKDNGEVIDNSKLIKETNLRNCSKVILI